MRESPGDVQKRERAERRVMAHFKRAANSGYPVRTWYLDGERFAVTDGYCALIVARTHAMFDSRRMFPVFPTAEQNCLVSPGGLLGVRPVPNFLHGDHADAKELRLTSWLGESSYITYRVLKLGDLPIYVNHKFTDLLAYRWWELQSFKWFGTAADKVVLVKTGDGLVMAVMPASARFNDALPPTDKPELG